MARGAPTLAGLRSLPPGRAAFECLGEGDNPPVAKIAENAENAENAANEPPSTGAASGRVLATRREAFARLLGLAGASGVGVQAAGCASPPPGPAPARVPLSALPPGGRLRVLHRGDPVELRWEGESVLARSLLCTHQGCEVRWRAEIGRYRCPCHQGIFDAAGQPFSGPPTRPLGVIQVRIEAGEIVVADVPKS